jgi:hypothetical protein
MVGNPYLIALRQSCPATIASQIPGIRLLLERLRASERLTDEENSWPTVAESDSWSQDRTALDTLRGSQTEYFHTFGIAFLPREWKLGCQNLRKGIIQMRTVLQDLSYALRMLRKNPGFALVVVLTLALGIGANTAIFTVVNTVLLRPLPYPEPDRIVQFVLRSPQEGDFNIISVPKFMIWRDQTDSFTDFSLYDEQSLGVNLTGGDRPEQLKGIHASADYFRLFGAQVEVGRTFSEQ